MLHYKSNQPLYKLHFSELEESAVKVFSFEGEESISRLFEYRFDLISADPELEAKSILNKKAAFTLTRGDEDPLKIHGIISRFEQRGRTPDYVSYYAVLVPKMWRLNLTYQSEIYQHMDIAEIIAAVLENSGFAGNDYKIQLEQSYPELEYVVQYRETNFNFLNRRLEHYGISYYFEHVDGNEVVVFTDSNTSLPGIAQEEEIYYNPNKDQLGAQETISFLSCEEKIVTGQVRLKDYNYRFPDKSLLAESQLDANGVGLYYEYGDHFRDEQEGGFLARVRNEEILCASKVFKGKSDCRLFRAGYKFKMGRHYRAEWNEPEYLVTRLNVRGSQQGLFAFMGGARASLPTYENSFETISAEIAYRPPRRTPIPKMHGIMNGVTTAAAGEQYAYIDDKGRYRLKMPFDLSERESDESSQPVRLASPHAGADYGMHFPQHAGVEIAWACIDGNVDRPIGLGTVPNEATASPVSTANKSMNVLRTSSGNALEMEDAGGGERIKLSTPYANTVIQLGSPNHPGEGIVERTDNDLTIEVGRDRKMKIQKNDSVKIFGDRSIFILGKRDQKVLKDNKEFVLGSQKQIVVGKEENKIVRDRSETVIGNIKLKTPKNYSLSTGQKVTLAAKGNIGAASGKNIGIGARKNISMAAKDNVTIKAKKKMTLISLLDMILKTSKDFVLSCKENAVITAKKKITMSAKEAFLLKSDEEIVLKCGSGSITMKQDGSIKIKGLKVEIEADTDVNMKGVNVSAEATAGGKLKGAMVNVEASAIATIKGALVKVN